MRILMIGLGGVGQRHLRNIRSPARKMLPEVIAYRVRRQTHVVTPTMNADPNRNIEQEYSIRVFPTLVEALEQNPEIAFICNPSSLHIPVALACIRAGCDVFIEKPLSDSLDGADDLVCAATETKRVAMVGYQLRFGPCLRKLAEIVESGGTWQSSCCPLDDRGVSSQLASLRRLSPDVRLKGRSWWGRGAFSDPRIRLSLFPLRLSAQDLRDWRPLE